MSSEQSGNNNTYFWVSVGRNLKDAWKMHQAPGLLRFEKNGDGGLSRPWGNAVEHCLCQVPRDEVLGDWLGFSQDLITEMKKAALLHDYDKDEEKKVLAEADKNHTSPLAAILEKDKRSDQRLRNYGLSEKVIWLASAAGGLPFELLECKRLLDKQDRSDEELAYLIRHYNDDISVGSKWVQPGVIDFRAERNKASAYNRSLSKEVEEFLKEDPFFGGMNNFDAMAAVSHLIEQCLAAEIFKRTGETIDPLKLPEIIDERVRAKIVAFSTSN